VKRRGQVLVGTLTINVCDTSIEGSKQVVQDKKISFRRTRSKRWKAESWGEISQAVENLCDLMGEKGGKEKKSRGFTNRWSEYEKKKSSGVQKREKKLGKKETGGKGGWGQ